MKWMVAVLVLAGACRSGQAPSSVATLAKLRDDPCPPTMAETSRDGDRVTCTLGAETVEVTFDPSGTAASYVTRLDGVLHGDYRHILPNVTEQGRYQHGRKIGKWREWDADSGQMREGSYVSGARNGLWKVFGTPDHDDQDWPLFEVEFQGGQRMRARKNVRRYHGWMLALDGALMAAMYYGHDQGRSDIEYGSALGFTLLPPLFHGIMQDEHLENAAASLAVRPAMIAAIFGLVTVFKTAPRPRLPGHTMNPA